MKKLYLLAMAAVTAFSANATLYLTGTALGLGWTPETPMEVEAVDGVYNFELTFAKDTNFKMSTAKGGWDAYNDQTYSLGYGVTITLDQELNLIKGDRYNNQNLNVPQSNSVYTFKVKEDMTTMTVTRKGDVEYTYSYAIHGQLFGTDWQPMAMTKNEDGTWSLIAEVKAGEFGVRAYDEKYGIDTQLDWFGKGNLTIDAEEGIVTEATNNYKLNVNGDVQFVFNPETATLSIKALQAATTVVMRAALWYDADEDNWGNRTMLYDKETATYSITANVHAGSFGFNIGAGDTNTWLGWDSEFTYTGGLEATENGGNIYNTQNGECTFILDLNNKTLSATYTPYRIYLVGGVNNWTINDNWMFVSEDGINYQLDTKAVIPAGSEFKLAGVNATGKAEWFEGINYGLNSIARATLSAPVDENIAIHHAGSNNIIFDNEYNGTIKLSLPEGAGKDGSVMFMSNNLSGVSDIEADAQAPAQYYNLQGMPVANPENGIYIVRRGNTISKVYVK